jgi:flagellar biosynthesis protein FliP
MMHRRILWLLIAIFLFPSCTLAQEPVPDAGRQLADQFLRGGASSQIVQYIALIALLSVAPGLLIVATSFTRLVVALSFVRSSIGLQSTPATIILVLLALFLTFFIMAPTFQRAYDEGIQPFTEQKISSEEAYERVTAPFRQFMQKNVREKELAFFVERAELSGIGADIAPSDFRVLVPAFMISELRRGFEIGFLIALPFLVIDIVVATVTMSMGMMMLPPTVISLPFKVLFFVLIDGWTLLAGSLIDSFT